VVADSVPGIVVHVEHGSTAQGASEEHRVIDASASSGHQWIFPLASIVVEDRAWQFHFPAHGSTSNNDGCCHEVPAFSKPSTHDLHAKRCTA